jgi:transaldolase
MSQKPVTSRDNGADSANPGDKSTDENVSESLGDTASAPSGRKMAPTGATAQRCLWASTSTKNPAYRDVLYVEELIGPETVNTMPDETIRAFQDHGRVELTLERGIDEARELLRRIAEAGVDYDDVTATLEREGVEKFSDSFAELLDGIRAKSGELVAT